MTMEDERKRQEKLRVLLLQCRSRLQPLDVDLPQNGHRRVAGLRREEVAELAGVSTDWYRSFESGRAIRVSVQFLARLARALRLTVTESHLLFHLAVPELYEMQTVFRLNETQHRHAFTKNSMWTLRPRLRKGSGSHSLW